MKKVKKNIGVKIFALVWLVFIFASAISNFGLFADSLSAVRTEELGFKGFIDKVKSSYTSDVTLKTAYINLNGLFARLTGRTVYNEVATLKNGMLTAETVGEWDITPYAQTLSEFSRWLARNNIKYFYVQAPYKVDMKNEVLPDGILNGANANADSMVNYLADRDVDVLDLREYISADAEGINKYYYNTDHHWNNDGAFVAFQKITEAIYENYNEEEFKSSFLDKENWKAETYEDVFLGSLGKRVGKYYGGTDDLIYYSPKAETRMALYNNKYLKYFSGSFDDANKREGNLERDYFSKNPYAVYIGGDYPIVKHFNPDAELDLKVLFIKDSYSLPVQAFMSTVFKRIDVIDPRHIKAYTVSGYIECFKPDVVIQMMNPSVFTNKEYFELGMEEADYFYADSPHTVLKKKSYKVKTEGDRKYSRFATELSPETKYTFSFDDIEFKKNKNKRMTVALYNAETKEIIDSHIFDMKLCDEKEYREWTFITPDSKGTDIQLIIYAGEYKKISGNKQLVVKNAKLTEYR